MTIQVRDRGENSLAHFVTIDISIIDENDNSPQAFITFVNPLINNSIMSIVENTPIGEILAHISISDQDSGLNGEMSYKIEQGEDLIGIKALDQKSYLLITNCLIDREDGNIKSDKFILIIYDHGKPSKSIRLEYQISIIDLNDSPPTFSPSMKCNLNLNLSKNRSLGLFIRKITIGISININYFIFLDQPLFQVQANDLDFEENGLISYLILPPYENLFTINAQGEVFNVDHLNETSYYLQIMAIDHGKPVRLNSTYSCQLSTYNNNDPDNINKSLSLINSIAIFQYNYIYLFIIFLIFLFVLTIYCFYKLIFDHRKSYKENKTYHLYVSVPRKSSYDNNEFISQSQFNQNLLEENERLVQANNDKVFNKKLIELYSD